MALTPISTMPTQLSSSGSNCLNDANQVGGCRELGGSSVLPHPHGQFMLGAGGELCTLAWLVGCF